MATTPTPAPTPPSAGELWQVALKMRKHLLKKLEKLRSDDATGLDVSHFEAIDSDLEKFRLACVGVIFFDFTFAFDETVEQVLWSIHTAINTDYRRVLGKLKNSSHAVEKRKVDKMYNNFLRIAQKFYKGYIQRLAARYDIPELKRVALGIESEQITAQDTTAPASPDLNAKVLASCHSTLIRLGDLARYRVHARQRKHGYDSALVFYGLAHDLVPDSGFAFHQIGIIYLDEANHLEVVYHFYRSLATQEPHPNAVLNLENEFKNVQLPSSSGKNRPAPSSPTGDAFSMWFVRLHALFYKGEVSSKHDELEAEVLHRLDIAAKETTSSALLIKMIMINMSAYHVASTRFEETGSTTASRFCHYILRFNLRFIRTICRALESEQTRLSDMTSDPAPENTGTTVDRLLPLIRTYVVWLAACREGVFGAADALGGALQDMLWSLAKVFTLLCAQVYRNQEGLVSCPYLLPEDMIVRGLRPLRDVVVPEACRFHCAEDGQMKPRLQDENQQLPAHHETWARILDILRGAYFLAEDSTVPIGYRIEQDSLVFEFQPQHVQSADAQKRTPMVAVTESEERRPAAPEAQKSHAPTGSFANPLVGTEQTPPPARPTTQAQEQRAIEDADQNLIDMLAPFLRPPTPQHQQSSKETSYGMHTETAMDVFGGHGQGEPSPLGSGPSRKLEPLPWGWVFTPTPHKELPSPGYGGFTGQNNAAPSPRNMLTGSDDPFVSPTRYQPNPMLPQAQRPLHQTTNHTATEDTHRNQLLQSFGITNNAPCASSFSNWSHATPLVHNQPPAAAWASKSPETRLPMSTDPTTFSDMSSLYHGTPANGAPYGWPVDGVHHHEQNQTPSSQQFQMNSRTTDYDSAILRSAYFGK